MATTMPKELPEMDTGKEVHVQNGEEHVASISMAAPEINGDVGIEKQGEELEEGTHPAATGTAAGASYLHPLVLEESESDFEDQTWINHPPSSPDGSLLHAMYFQLLGAGFDGMIVREFFRSRARTWKKAFKKPVAALAEPAAMEFEEMHHSMGDMEMPSRVGNQVNDSNGEQLQQQQMPKSVPRRHRVANKKTDANVGSSKPQGQVRTRTTRTLPPHIGIRTKTPVKKNKGYLKNRLGDFSEGNKGNLKNPLGDSSEENKGNLKNPLGNSSEENKGNLKNRLGDFTEEASLHSQVSQ